MPVCYKSNTNKCCTFRFWASRGRTSIDDAFEEETGDSIVSVIFYPDPNSSDFFLKATSTTVNDVTNVYYWGITQSISSNYFTVEADPGITTYTNCKMVGCVCQAPCGPCRTGETGTCTKIDKNKILLNGHIGSFY